MAKRKFILELNDEVLFEDKGEELRAFVWFINCSDKSIIARDKMKKLHCINVKYIKKCRKKD